MHRENADRSVTVDPGHPAAPARRARVVTGFGILGLFLPLLWADAVGLWGAGPAMWLLPVALALAVGAAIELAGLLARVGLRPRLPLLLAGSLAILAAAALSNPAFMEPGRGGSPLVAAGWVAATLVATTIVAFVAEIAAYRPGGNAIQRLAGTGLGLLAVALPLSFLVSLRLTGTPTHDSGWHPPGLAPLVAMIAAVKTGDVCAYLVGSTLGRRRMAPLLSPGKTWEGAAGSFLGALVASWVVLGPLQAMLTPAGGGAAGPLGGWVAHGLLVGAAGIIGDLSESLLKREAAVKDSGTTLGALGGLFDLVDSLLVAAPVAWLLWVLAAPS
jgi:phosphatidate cytidylyltransferase